MCLHAGADQSQRITCKLTTCARHSATRKQDEHAGVRAVGAITLQVAVLQRLKGKHKMGS